MVAVLRPCRCGRLFSGGVCGAAGVSGTAWGRAALCARGRRPAREPSAPRAFGSARRLEARPGPAAAHGHRSQALRSLRRPPHQWSRVCCWLARRVGSKPGQAPPPPTGAAARPSGPFGALHTSGAGCAVGWLGASARSPARPRRRPRAPQPGPPVPSAPSTPVEPGVLLVGSARRLESRLSSQTLTSPIPEPHPISHVIPPRPFQILKSDRCHCNVF